MEPLAANQRVLTIAAIGGQNNIVQTRTLAMMPLFGFFRFFGEFQGHRGIKGGYDDARC
jgi:hypothetical protein